MAWRILLSCWLLPLVACSAQTPCELSELGLVSRAEWGAHAPDWENAPDEHGLYDAQKNLEGWRVYDQPLKGLLTTLVVHHSALPQNGTPLEIQEFHLKQRGYADIAYHFVVGMDGTLYEGRALNVRGAHTGGHNTGTVGVVLTGNFEHDQPTPAQLQMLTRLAACLRAQYGITHLAGHKDFLPGETTCPGENLFPLLPELAKQLKLEYGTQGYQSPYTPVSPKN